MTFEFRLPDIGEGVVEGEVVRWLVKEGERVDEDQPMVEVMTDKATVEIPTPKAGRIASISAPEGKTCKVGQVMVRIETDGAVAEPRASANGPATPVAATQKDFSAVQQINAATQQQGKAVATPATRRLARELGVDLSSVPATGDNGRVTTEDVRAFASGAAAAVARTEVAPLSSTAAPQPVVIVEGDERIPFRGVRRKIAENMARSKHTAAHFTYVEEADLTDLVALRTRARKRAEERGVKLSFLPFIVKAVVTGLKKYPIINSTLDEERGEIVLRKHYHVGVAAASQQGLMVPVIRDADRKSLFEIARELDELGERARQGRASREELTGSTFTISSLGTLGGLLATPIINHPEVAILGVHKIKQTPVVRDGQIVIREIANFSISLDHRVVDGYEGAQFLQHVIELLSDPTLLFMELV
jgi:pyruvate dehydrogenase E2 component (dihydrolipoamide acetyltransferase)